MSMTQNLRDGLETALIDRGFRSDPVYRPEFISNNSSRGRRVLSAIEEELLSCDEFFLSVAFITLGGVTPLLQVFRELEKRGIRGKILTTDYEVFNDPAALEKLHSLKNIELKMFAAEGEKDGFHTKGYIFRRNDLYRVVIGSSNLTANALKLNREWNTKLIGSESGEMIGEILQEFHQLWEDSWSLSYDDFMEDYRIRYELVKKQRKTARAADPVSLEQYTLKPNSMQTAFVRNLRRLAGSGEKKALLISATGTGTGKTYASAFGLRELKPDKLLFVVHREQIAKQAIESYRKVFGMQKEDGSRRQYELLSGSTRSRLDQIKNADFIFATMQTICKEEVLHAFRRDAFSSICLDEAHHSGADSYQKILDYFTPDFWLGMTASPETNRFDVFEIFDHNIAYEIRLQQALEENLLCPFLYFGITDLYADGKLLGDEEDPGGLRNFSRLVSDDRVNYVVNYPF